MQERYVKEDSLQGPVDGITLDKEHFISGQNRLLELVMNRLVDLIA